MGVCTSSPHELAVPTQCSVQQQSATDTTELICRKQFILKKPGDVNQHYEIDPEPLGKGTFGVVHRGLHMATGAERAIKRIARSSVNDVRQFRQEVGFMKTLDHPHIIRLYETFEDESNVYLAMEMCRGGELFDRVIASGHLTEHQASVVVQHIVRAVAYMHEKDIAHRDLKPENFLFETKDPVEKNVLKLIDFGTACRAGPRTVLTTLVGTRYYIAPQVLMKRYDRKCDMWSVGAVMYTLLCGRPPFSGRTEKEVLQKVRLGKYDLTGEEWQSVSEDAKDLIRMLMHMIPRARLSARQALKHVWIRKSAPCASCSPLQEGLVENLRSFHSENRLKKAALHIVASHLDDAQLGRLRETFNCLDANGDGMLSLEELKRVLNQEGLEDLTADLEHMVRGIDVDHSGAIDYTEFLAASLSGRETISRQALWSAFSVFDLDGDGRISEEELTIVLDNGRRSSASIDLLHALDSDGDGSIDFEEFMVMMRGSVSTSSSGSKGKISDEQEQPIEEDLLAKVARSGG